MKRILALAAALCLTLCLAVTAFADGVDFTVTLSEDYVQQSETEYINSNNYINGNQHTVIARLLQTPRTDDLDDPYSEAGLEQIQLALPDESFGDMTFFKTLEEPEVVSVGEDQYLAVLLRYNCMRGGELTRVADYRMYSADTVYIYRFIGDVVFVEIASGGNPASGAITFADGIEVQAPEPEVTEEPESTDAAPEASQTQQETSETRSAASVGPIIGRFAVVFLIGALAAGIPSFLQYRKFQSVLQQCETFAQDPDAFAHKGKYYNQSKFIELRAPVWATLSKKQLAQAIEKQARKVKTPLDEAEHIAMRVAYERKAD